MNIVRTPEEMREWSLRQHARGRTIGFVPTMGALHEGHASLMRAAVAENNSAAVSIFVNPTQFAPSEDFSAYPRTFDDDTALCKALGVQCVYAPEAAAVYPPGYASYVDVEGLGAGLCGRARPHHFRGVATVVAKLFNTVLPHRAYFGQKDAQQCAIIRRMARDLDTCVEVVEMPIVREAGGLAMSSRNRYLNAEERARALCLSRGLARAERLLAQGEREAQVLVDAVRAEMSAVDIDYVELVDADTLAPVQRVAGPILLAVAARVGPARLIDNLKYPPSPDPAAHPRSREAGSADLGERAHDGVARLQTHERGT